MTKQQAERNCKQRATKMVRKVNTAIAVKKCNMQSAILSYKAGKIYTA